MKICVLMRQVPDKDSTLKIDETNLEIENSDFFHLFQKVHF